MITSNEQMRIAKIEAVCDQIRSEMSDVIERAYAIAVEERDEDRAAELARKIRNKLLDDSDKYCTFDKILPEAPSGSSFTDWIEWLKTLAGVASNAWGVYRQSLRDLPDQKGFPFEIEWPLRPDNKNNQQ